MPTGGRRGKVAVSLHSSGCPTAACSQRPAVSLCLRFPPVDSSSSGAGASPQRSSPPMLDNPGLRSFPATQRRKRCRPRHFSARSRCTMLRRATFTLCAQPAAGLSHACLQEALPLGVSAVTLA